jgi:hypothetical protein
MYFIIGRLIHQFETKYDLSKFKLVRLMYWMWLTFYENILTSFYRWGNNCVFNNYTRIKLIYDNLHLLLSMAK